MFQKCNVKNTEDEHRENSVQNTLKNTNIIKQNINVLISYSFVYCLIISMNVHLRIYFFSREAACSEHYIVCSSICQCLTNVKGV